MKKSKLSEKRILIGLISLLFVVTFVHTIGILGLANVEENKNPSPGSQNAQVVSALNCLQVAPTFNLFRGLDDDFQPTYQNVHFFEVHVSIRNLCDTPVYVMSPASFNQSDKNGFVTQLTSMGIQYFDSGTSGPVNINTTSPQHPIRVQSEVSSCNNCQNGTYTYLPAVGGQVSAAAIPAGVTKQFMFTIGVNTLDESYFFYRAILKKIKWFNQSALTDNQIVDSEFRSYNVSTSQQNNFATDYTNVFRMPE